MQRPGAWVPCCAETLGRRPGPTLSSTPRSPNGNVEKGFGNVEKCDVHVPQSLDVQKYEGAAMSIAIHQFLRPDQWHGE
jgi:hypothetical protein